MNDSQDHPALSVLKEAAQGLLFPSETDAPLLPFFWPDADTSPLTSDRVRALGGVAEGAPLKSVSLAAFFRPATKAEEWHDAEEAGEVERFKGLVAVLKATLKQPQAWRAGEVKIEVYIVGAVEGGWAGLQTHVVET